MSRRISHSLLDPVIGPRLQAAYRHLPIPRSLPPEAIVLTGHLSAIVGAIGFAHSTTSVWGGLIAAMGIAGNHFADCIDGTHARATGQCRNGGELLDHFTDPLSFAYWLIGIGVACGRLDLALVAVVVLFAMAVLTNIKAKLTGEFTLARFGPTEFKATLVGLGMVTAIAVASGSTMLTGPAVLLVAYAGLIILGLCLLPWQLAQSVAEVNRSTLQPDTHAWELRR